MACSAALLKTIEELYLIRCSLLPTETLHFFHPDHNDEVDAAKSWMGILDEYATTMTVPDLFASHIGIRRVPPTFKVTFDSPSLLSNVWLEVDISVFGSGTPGETALKGDSLTRADQERWQELRKQKEAEVAGAEYPTYELLSMHLLPFLHEYFGSETSADEQECHIRLNDYANDVSTRDSERKHYIYHALLTSHHLVSLTKRRSLQEWSSSLSISGFAKVGHPGVIYAEGERDDVEEFVANVKAMQWLALRVRFVEPLLEMSARFREDEEDIRKTGRWKEWKEFQKVGEVVQEMKRLGREKYIMEMGIGSAGGKSK